MLPFSLYRLTLDFLRTLVTASAAMGFVTEFSLSTDGRALERSADEGRSLTLRSTSSETVGIPAADAWGLKDEAADPSADDVFFSWTFKISAGSNFGGYCRIFFSFF